MQPHGSGIGNITYKLASLPKHLESTSFSRTAVDTLPRIGPIIVRGAICILSI